MGHELAGLFGAGLGFAVVAIWIGGTALLVALPFIVISITRNIRQIRIQLERLNDTLESRGRSSGGGVLGI